MNTTLTQRIDAINAERARKAPRTQEQRNAWAGRFLDLTQGVRLSPEDFERVAELQAAGWTPEEALTLL